MSRNTFVVVEEPLHSLHTFLALLDKVVQVKTVLSTKMIRSVDDAVAIFYEVGTDAGEDLGKAFDL